MIDLPGMYYPGDPLDMLTHNPTFFSEFREGYERKKVQAKTGMTKEEWIKRIEFNRDKGTQFISSWRQGVNAFYMAAQFTASENGLEVPVIEAVALDVWEKDLTDPTKFQDARDRAELYKTLLIAQQAEERESVKALILPHIRISMDSEYNKRLLNAQIERYRQVEGVEPNYVTSVDENPPYEDQDERLYFLAGAVMLHDLFAIQYELDAFRKSFGAS